MRILFVTRINLGCWVSGVRIQIDETAKALRALGHEVVYFDPWANPVPDADVVHFFGVEGYMMPLAQYGRSLGKALVGSTLLPVGGCSPRRYAAMTRLAHAVPGLLHPFRQRWRLLHMLDGLIVLNEAERRLLAKAYALRDARVHLVPNGIDKAFAAGDATLFEQAYGVRDFVLHVGYFYPLKNQLGLIRAVRPLPYPLVLVGPVRDGYADYLAECKAEADEKVHFIGPLAHDDPLLVSAYHAARVFALPSTQEIQPLVLIEAALAGCHLVTSTRVPLQPVLAGYVERAAHDDCKGLGSCIEKQWHLPEDRSPRDAILAHPDWVEVARRIEAIYAEAISRARPRAAEA